MLNNAYLSGTPFAITASPQMAACWAGRPSVRERLIRMRRSILQRPDSTFDLIWANLGAGKSHVLYHFRHLVRDDAHLQCIFLEMPQETRSFLEIYRAIVDGWPADAIVNSLHDVVDSSSELSRAVRVMKFGGLEDRAVALSWLKGEAPYLRALKTTTGIGRRIDNDEHALQVLNQMILAQAQTGGRVILLLDEFQRIARTPERYRTRVLSCVRSMFSKNPTALSMLAGVGTRLESTALSMIPPELRTLLGPRPMISLPEMSVDEAVDFALARMACCRPVNYAGPVAAPFGSEALRAIVETIDKAEGVRLIPRTILQALAWVYDEACEEANQDHIAPDKARGLCAELRWHEPGEDT